MNGPEIVDDNGFRVCLLSMEQLGAWEKKHQRGITSKDCLQIFKLYFPLILISALELVSPALCYQLYLAYDKWVPNQTIPEFYHNFLDLKLDFWFCAAIGLVILLIHIIIKLFLESRETKFAIKNIALTLKEEAKDLEDRINEIYKNGFKTNLKILNGMERNINKCQSDRDRVRHTEIDGSIASPDILIIGLFGKNSILIILFR